MSWFDDNEDRITGLRRGNYHYANYKPKFTWQTKDGKVLTHDKMEVGHLLNCIRVLERRGQGDSLHAEAMRSEIKRREATDV
jgi:hypothetical protein